MHSNEISLNNDIYIQYHISRINYFRKIFSYNYLFVFLILKNNRQFIFTSSRVMRYERKDNELTYIRTNKHFSNKFIKYKNKVDFKF